MQFALGMLHYNYVKTNGNSCLWKVRRDMIEQ